TSVKSGNFLGGRYLIYSDVRANDFINRTQNAVTASQVWNHTLTETSTNDVINMWNSAYAGINQINVFLDGMEANSGKFVPPNFPTDFATVTAPQYIAEARLLRALSYYSLLQLYARPFTDGNGSKPGLPLRLLAEKSSLNSDLARSSVGEIYTQILADLNFAEQNLPVNYSTATLRVTRAHKNTAIALKTRVYLSMGNYASVITEANKLAPQTAAPFSSPIGPTHALQSSIANVFASPQETLESIFSFPFTANNTPGGQNQLGFYYLSSTAVAGVAPVGGGEFSLNSTASGLVANTVDLPTTDARRTNFIYTVGGEFYLKKYNGGTPYIEKAPMIRYAEVLLSLSEAIARTNGDNTRALNLLNAVRARSGKPVLAVATNAQIADQVVIERRVEFLGEGLRNGDLMRLNATIPAKGPVLAVQPSESKYIWPIPQPELATNLLMTRND
ncbi:MAG TPA: RagB/SusD family nutrient uptake outer membrane protein, partial [Cyclobacteriaceae bacterium]|nr:RagB/SusD family nutrient uptake outer membrane protein [Cyclobacteriaceae bacterium]